MIINREGISVATLSDQLSWIIFCNRCGLVLYHAQTKSENGRYFPLGRKMFDNTTQANRNRQFGELNELVLINQSEFAVASVRRGEQNGVNKGDFCLIGPLEITLTHALYHPFPSRWLLARIE